MSSDARIAAGLVCGKCGAEIEPIEEYDIRYWFKHENLAQAKDTFRVVAGILEAREELQPKRKRRSDAGHPRLELKEPGSK